MTVMTLSSRFGLLALLLLIIPVFVGRAQSAAVRDKQGPRPVSPVGSPTPKPTPPAKGELTDTDVIRTDTDLVNTVFTAMDRDRHFITTLQAADLRILENSVPQDISLFERETNRPLTLIVLVDTSKSQERTLPDEQRAAKLFLASVMRPRTDRVAVVSFTGEAEVQQDLTADLLKLNRALERLKVEVPPDNPECQAVRSPREDPRCWTGVWDAVWASTSGLLATVPETSRRAIVLLSDGDDTSSITKRQEAIDSALRNSVAIYSIGIGDSEFYKIEKGSLEKLSNRTGGRAFFPRSEEELQRAFRQIEEELRSQYVIAYSPKNKTRDGSRRELKLEIVNPELRKQKLQLIYRDSYYAPGK